MVVEMSEDNNRSKQQSTRPAAKATSSSPWWSLPPAIRRVFDNFPLVTYPSDPLPQRAHRGRNENILYIFQSADPKHRDAPSFNPSCLKWQAYLKFHGIPLHARPSNNHASPTGALPFLLPAPKEASRPSSPVPANRLARWVVSQRGDEESIHVRQEAYTALIDHTIRSAWLYYLYLDDGNFDAVAWPLYVASASSSYAVRLCLGRQLRTAARDELLKTITIIDPQELYRQAEQAFHSLSTLLGADKFFFGQTTPGLFDASLFAYTQIILDDSLNFSNPTLKKALQDQANLVQHRDRLIRGFFSG